MEFEIAVSLLVGLFIGIAVGNCWHGQGAGALVPTCASESCWAPIFPLGPATCLDNARYTGIF
jgi:hypothetical protein